MKDKNRVSEIVRGGMLGLTGLLLFGSISFAEASQGDNPCEGAYPEYGIVGTTDACFPEGEGAPIPSAEFTDPTAAPTSEPLTVPPHLTPVLVSGVEGYSVDGQDGVIPRSEFTDPTAVPTPETMEIPSRFQPDVVSGVEVYRVPGQDGVIPRSEFTDPR